MPSELLVSRILGEYSEMPDLSLTLAQTCRSWRLDLREVEAILESLVAEDFLGRTRDGAFFALPRCAHSVPVSHIIR